MLVDRTVRDCNRLCAVCSVWECLWNQLIKKQHKDNQIWPRKRGWGRFLCLQFQCRGFSVWNLRTRMPYFLEYVYLCVCVALVCVSSTSSGVLLTPGAGEWDWNAPVNTICLNLHWGLAQITPSPQLCFFSSRPSFQSFPPPSFLCFCFKCLPSTHPPLGPVQGLCAQGPASVVQRIKATNV